MSYDVKRTEYAFLPDGPYPLDARSHFVNFAVANETITGDKVSTVELADESNDTQKFYYHGEIITTTEGGVYQVCGKNQYYSDIELPKVVGTYTTRQFGNQWIIYIDIQSSAYWSEQSTSATSWDVSSVTIIINDRCGVAQFQFDLEFQEAVASRDFTSSIHNTLYDENHPCYLKPLSGSGGGGGSSLVINPGGGLDNPVTGLQIKIPDVSGVQINNNGLSIKVLNPTTDADGTIHGSGLTISASGISLNTGPGLTINDTGQLTVNYGKGLTINPETNALEIDGDLDVRGVHSSVDRDYDVDKNILEGNYVYQEI